MWRLYALVACMIEFVWSSSGRAMLPLKPATHGPTLTTDNVAVNIGPCVAGFTVSVVFLTKFDVMFDVT